MDSGEDFLLKMQNEESQPTTENLEEQSDKNQNNEDSRRPSFHPFEANPIPYTTSYKPLKQNGAGPIYSSHALEDDFIKSMKDRYLSTNLTKRPTKRIDNLPDLKAMSMASLYDRDMRDMDTDRINTMDSSVDKCDHASQTCFDNTCNTCPPNPFGDASLNNSLYFSDGLRSVDFVLAWSPDDNLSVERTNLNKRKVFEQNLINEGLEIERETLDDDLNFVKIHAPMEVLRRYSEILKLRMPMKESLCHINNPMPTTPLIAAAQYISRKIPGFDGVKQTTSTVYVQLKGIFASVLKYILVDKEHFPRRSQRFTAVYSRDKEYLFDLQQSCFFTASVRSRIVQFILDRKRFTLGIEDDFAFGIERLISDDVYLAAYPLHDGEIAIPGSMRHLLYSEWASVRKWYRYQPLDYIKEYFGVKIGLYFAWLGYYTYMLLLASIVGVLCFLYSWFTVNNNIPSNEICNGTTDYKMCPLCDHWCDYWDLKTTCVHARVTYLIDNPTTVFFAIFMSFWATLFLELWKRYSAEITHRWDLTGFDVHEEHPRPQYLARLAHVEKVRIDYVTNTTEPQPPFWRMKLPATVFSFSVVLLLIMLAFAAVLGVVLYRMSMLAALRFYGVHVTTANALLFTTATAACINLCLIFVFNYMYTYLAEYLTELELLRTQTEFDDSLTLKIYLLQFVNYYASIFYVAFFKGKFIGHPGDYNRFFNYRQEECGFGGCLLELCIQLAIIMIGKQTMNTILEMLLPMFYKWLNTMRVKFFNRNKSSSVKGKGERWLRDLKLIEFGSRGLFPEYLEMILQYGFVTIFVAAFPLAPFFALLNNILEMRLDAKKLLTYYRRPVSQRVRNIGVWYRILDSIGKLSVITNGFIIAFTSDFIPRLLYRTIVSDDGSLNGYLNYSLAYFDTNHLQNDSKPNFPSQNVSLCRYLDYRNPPTHEHKYIRTDMYWTILASKLAFIVIFENLVALVMIVVRWCIPDMHVELRDKIRREAYITNEIIIKQETMRARYDRASSEPGVNLAVEEPKMNFLKMEKLMSGMELDLVMHGPEDPVAPGHCPPDRYKNEGSTKNSNIGSESV